MKTKTKKLTAILLALCLVLGLSAMASADAPSPTVRVNGHVVSFPDAQPYIDENSRTMIPVRFVTEELGAEVTWNGETRTVGISKGGIETEITIGSPELKVKTQDEAFAVTMDTEAVIKEDRTFVPIRFVVEALGGTVDYSEVYRTVGIYDDVLYWDEIDQLRSYPYTWPESTIGYDEAQELYSEEDLPFFYGTDRDSFANFANAHEHLYRLFTKNWNNSFPALGITLDGVSCEDFYDAVVSEAAEELCREDSHLTLRFIADTSCIYQSDSMDRLTTTVRGIVYAWMNVEPAELTGEETALLYSLGFTELYKDTNMCVPVDIHMNTQAGDTVNIHTIIPLDDEATWR